MLKKFKSRTELAKELGIHPKTLSNYMKALDIKWGKKLMPPHVWEQIICALDGDDKPPSRDGDP